MRIAHRSSTTIGLVLSLYFVVTANASWAASRSFENDRCTDCHISKTARSHPTGIAPPVNNEDLVLTADGTIGCVTCHYAHDSLPVGIGARATKLRVRCRTCHGVSIGHTSQTSLVHELRDTAGARAALKPQTRTCIACHDGSSGPDTHVNDGPQMFSDNNQIFTTTGNAPQLGRSHPILIDYETVALSNSHGYRSDSQMSPIVQFENGDLGCLSCHDLFNLSQAERLVQTNVRSALCLQCHNMSPPPDASGTGPGLLALARSGRLVPYHGEAVFASR